MPKDVLRERVPFWTEHSYNDDSLEEGKRSLLDYLQRRGFYDAKITWTKDTSGENILVRFVVEPGTKYEISEIVINGNQHLTDREILAGIETKKSGVFYSSRLVTKIFEDDLKNVLNAYRQIGFLF